MRQKSVADGLEPLFDAIDRLHIIVGQLPSTQLKVGLDSGGGDTLADYAPALLYAPLKQHLLHCLLLCISDVEQGLVAMQG